jgi:uncharacterized membrane protein YfbV (UPF0208 family)
VYNIVYYPFLMVRYYAFFLIIGYFVFVYLDKKMYKDPKVNAVAIASCVYIVYLTAIIIKQERFLIMFVPFFCVLAGIAVQQLLSHEKRKAIVIGAFILFCASTLAALTEDGIYYRWWYANSERPAIIEDFYRYPSNHDIEGAIMTADPVFASYNDNLFLPYYFIQTDAPVFFNEWESDEEIAAIVYTESSFPCSDAQCLATRDRLHENISKRFSLAFNQTYYGSEHHIFVRHGATHD